MPTKYAYKIPATCDSYRSFVYRVIEDHSIVIERDTKVLLC